MKNLWNKWTGIALVKRIVVGLILGAPHHRTVNIHHDATIIKHQVAYHISLS